MVDTIQVGVGDAERQAEAPSGHDEAMAKKFDEAQAKAAQQAGLQTDESEERPNWLPEKFKSPEDLAKAYAELEKKLGKGSQEDAAKPSEEAPAEESAPADASEKTEADKAAEAAAQKAGFDLDALNAEYAENGALKDETLAKFEEAGIPRQMVQDYIEMVAERAEREVFSEFGGKEGYGKAVQWAAANMTPAEISAYNKAMDSGDMAQVKLATSALKARYESAMGKDAEVSLTGSTSNSGGLAPFMSRQEVTAAMADPRYAKDPAYRDQVAARLARSTVF